MRSGALARGGLLVAQATPAMAVATVRARTFNMQWPEAIDEREESRDQLVALVIGQPSEGDLAPEVLIAVGVATRTSQRALLGDLD